MTVIKSFVTENNGVLYVRIPAKVAREKGIRRGSVLECEIKWVLQ